MRDGTAALETLVTVGPGYALSRTRSPTYAKSATRRTAGSRRRAPSWARRSARRDRLGAGALARHDPLNGRLPDTHAPEATQQKDMT